MFARLRLAITHWPFQDGGEHRPGIATKLLAQIAADHDGKSAPAMEEIDIAKDVCAVAVVGKVSIPEISRIMI